MKKPTLIETQILKFLEKSGGLTKVIMAVNGFRNCPDERRAELIRNIAKSDAGARQLMAAALLGYTMAAEIGKHFSGNLDLVSGEN